MTLVRLAVLASIVVAAGAAQAQEWKPYGRLDFGVSLATDAGLTDKSTRAICGDQTCSTAGELNDVGGSRMIGMGAGFHVSPSTRFDITVNYRDSFRLKDHDNVPFNFQADVVSLSLLLNGYVDFPMSWGRPYLGAGIGYASNKVDRVLVSFEDPSLGTLGTSVPGGTKSGLAWSLAAGIGWPLSGGLIVDLGYRYLDLGKLETSSGPTACPGGFTCTCPVGASCTPVSYEGMSGHLRAHEIAIGIRY